VRVFGSCDSFVEATGTLRLGRLVANATFLEALLRHGPYDTHEIFCATEAERARVRELVDSFPDGRTLGRRLDLRLHLELPSRMRQAPWETMHFGGWSRYLPSIAWLRATLSPRYFPLTGLIHSIDGPSQAGQLRRLLAAPLGAADSVFCTSRAGREAFANQIAIVSEREGLSWKGRLDPVPLGVDERFFSPPDRGGARARLGVSPQARVALWLGRISATSKADLGPLLHQWRALAQEDGNRLLVLAGGATAAEAESIGQVARDLGIHGSVRILPDVDEGRKMDLLSGADVFVSPVDNHQETFGISVVEAMAAGLPVVASDWDGYKDLVDHGVTGFLVPVDWAPPPPEVVLLRQVLEPSLAQFAQAQAVSPDPASLRQNLSLLLSDPARSRSMGAAGREMTRRSFSWKAVVARSVAVWEELSRTGTGMPVPGAGSVDPEILDPAAVFAGYGSRPSGPPEGSACLTELAREVLAGRIPMPATFSDLMPISDGKLLTALVLGLRSGSKDAGLHLRESAVATGRPIEEAAWLLSWLRKYGLVEIG
jgi:glycosyltransferase involved in cell wall biosynthesis